MKYLIDILIASGLVLITLTILTGIYLVYSVALSTMDRDLQNKINEDKCIAMYISRGVEREDIKRLEGTCIIKFRENY